MNSLFALVVSFAVMLGQAQGMQPHVLIGGPHASYTITVRDRHIVAEKWNPSVVTIAAADERASEEWIKAHSLLPRLKIKRSNLYWDGKKVDLGKVKVTDIYQAFSWQGGVLIYGRTFPRRGFFGSWPFRGHLIETRDIEPYCAIYFDPNTLKGEDLWLNGKAYLPFFVFPIPH